jgi:hypothetical protein
MVEMRNACLIFVSKPEGKRQLGRPRHRWEDCIRMGVRKIECEGVEWIQVAQERDQWRGIF